jgi:hypothetical protein
MPAARHGRIRVNSPNLHIAGSAVVVDADAVRCGVRAQFGNFRRTGLPSVHTPICRAPRGNLRGAIYCRRWTGASPNRRGRRRQRPSTLRVSPCAASRLPTASGCGCATAILSKHEQRDTQRGTATAAMLSSQSSDAYATEQSSWILTNARRIERNSSRRSRHRLAVRTVPGALRSSSMSSSAALTSRLAAAKSVAATVVRSKSSAFSPPRCTRKLRTLV